jgi:hypothetical protein
LVGHPLLSPKKQAPENAMVGGWITTGGSAVFDHRPGLAAQTAIPKPTFPDDPSVESSLADVDIANHVRL